MTRPLGGKLSQNGTTFGKQVVLVCSEGDQLRGNASTMCLADGQWSNQIGECYGQGKWCLIVCRMEDIRQHNIVFLACCCNVM